MGFPILAAAMGLAEFAPSIVRWLSGENPEGVAKDIIERAKKVVKCDDVNDAMEVLRSDPLKLIEFQKAMLSFEAELEMGFLNDRRSARERDIAILQSGAKNYRGDVMVVSAAMGLVLCLASLAYFANDLPGEAVGILSTIAGIFGSCLKDAYAFEFGSSRGSKNKDSAVAALLERGYV